MADSRFNCIAIFDAIPEGHLNTAKLLCGELKDIADYKADGLHVRYYRIDSVDALKDGLERLHKEVSGNGILPWIHLEGHGLKDESGFVLANKSHFTWLQFKKLITPLNITLGLNLILVLATCYGGSFASSIRTTDTAPVLGLIGPKKEISAGKLGDGFKNFYQTFFETGSLKSAIQALNASAERGMYFRTTAEEFFYAVWTSYKKIQCTEEEINKRARSMYRALKKKKVDKIPSIGSLKRTLRHREPELFDEYRDTYFMYDRVPENRERFAVTYKEAELRAAR
jgi:hypothetical protein